MTDAQRRASPTARTMVRIGFSKADLAFLDVEGRRLGLNRSEIVRQLVATLRMECEPAVDLPLRSSLFRGLRT